MRAVGTGFDEYKSAHRVGVGGGGEHRGMTAERLADQDRPPQSQLPGEGHDVGDSPLERGYSAVLSASRKQVTA